ncbi:hypothetical protein [Metabacillus fastidiosus]|uniref:hypothetical protein n=1 Tax=Metabacillus fastidiosus TaxID=1458 RepID=UPI003D2D6E78
MFEDFKPCSLAEIGDFIGRAILLVCEYGAFKGGLRGFSETDIHIETAEGQVIAVSRSVLEDNLTELYVMEVY